MGESEIWLAGRGLRPMALTGPTQVQTVDDDMHAQTLTVMHEIA